MDRQEMTFRTGKATSAKASSGKEAQILTMERYAEMGNK